MHDLPGPLLPNRPSPEKVIFLGVNSQGSAALFNFPRWMHALGFTAQLEAVDLPVGSSSAEIRKTISRISQDSEIRGAIVTTHKISVHEYGRDMIHILAPQSQALGEVGLLRRAADGTLQGYAHDVESMAHALEDLFRTPWPGVENRDVFIIGAGGAGTALAYVLSSLNSEQPVTVTVADNDLRRVEILRAKLANWVDGRLVTVTEMSCHSEFIENMNFGSIIVNASGSGKDWPGNPLSSAVKFPRGAVLWDLNYRFLPQSEPTFLETGLRQAASRQLRLLDGWNLFLWSWAVALNALFDLHDPIIAFRAVKRVSDNWRNSISSPVEG
ncbi:hypothetical protein [Streptomyces sp. 351MFTsu5.1]|uniref:hypothetical protein n=1 Tax=Streptomyces sp. 351MFTsu5.1 TaxID=1172180 RepID=UPI001319DC24|nr:hypothetical protein [Streptomyces sp. 351MFTsu5.1]